MAADSTENFKTLIALNAISPLDGRYASKTHVLSEFFSEKALQKARVAVEIAWLIRLSETADLPEIPPLSASAKKILLAIEASFSDKDALQIKSIEAITNHDVKAIEYFLKEKMAVHPDLAGYVEFIHFACTSEDINNLAYARLITAARDKLLLPLYQKIEKQLLTFGHQYATIPMLARTHGQPATPTTVGKEIINFAARLKLAIATLAKIILSGKCNGATGNFNAHHVAYPQVDWANISQQFVISLSLEHQAYSTQIEPMDRLCELLHGMVRANSILVDLCRDVWGYISLKYFCQSKKSDEVGSSTMPHKINPIDFENAEGNFGLANALIAYFTQQLPTSRWQRDLVNSTILRNIGVAFAHTVVALLSLEKGFAKLSLNQTVIEYDLAQHPEVLTEAVQTVMRRYGLQDGYEQLKALSRGETLTLAALRQFIQSLALPESVKEGLIKLTPNDYTGLASFLAKQFS